MLGLIIAVILIFSIGPFILGLLLGLIRERAISLFLLFLIYVLLVLFWQGGMGTPSGPPTVAKASWFFGFYIVPSLIGYSIGYILTKKKKLPKIRLLNARLERKEDLSNTPLTDKKTRYCSNCGQQLSSDAKFCPKCGIALFNEFSDYVRTVQFRPNEAFFVVYFCPC